MKNETAATRNFDELVSRLSENEILNEQAMSIVKGGSTDGDGGEVIITKI